MIEDLELLSRQYLISNDFSILVLLLQRLQQIGKIWVRFHDLHAGGYQKLQWGHIYICANSLEEALNVFEEKFSQNPQAVTCSCCGPNYSYAEFETLEDATSYERSDKFISNDYYVPQVSLKNFLTRSDILVII